MSTCLKCGGALAADTAVCRTCGTKVEAGPVGEKRATRGKIYAYTPPPHIENRKRKAPKPTRRVDPTKGPIERFNAYLALRITNGVGTMWCAYAFAALALISLPEAIRAGTSPLIAWIAQTFLQLVLLSIIIVGQKVGSEASDIRGKDTYDDAEAVLHEAVQIQEHLVAQDDVLHKLIDELNALKPPVSPAP